MDPKTGSGNPLNTDPELSEQEEKELTSAEALARTDATKVAEKNKQLFARLRKEQDARKKADELASQRDAEFKKMQERLASFEKPPASGNGSPQGQNEDLPVREVLELRKQGFSEGEILDLVDQAKSLGVPVGKILSNEHFKAGFEVKRSKGKSEANTPAPSFTSVTSSTGKKWEDKGLSDDERRQMFSQMGAEARRKRGSSE